MQKQHRAILPEDDISKYMGMLEIVQDKGKPLNLLRMEKWILDSPGQAGEYLRKFIKDLYQENKLVKGERVINGTLVNLKNITMP
jgi:polyhydroxyalkanoate synthase